MRKGMRLFEDTVKASTVPVSPVQHYWGPVCPSLSFHEGTEAQLSSKCDLLENNECTPPPRTLS